MSKELSGEHWKDSGYSILYQLYRRVEGLAGNLQQRQKAGHAPLVSQIEELQSIAAELKSLDKRST